MPIRSQEKLNTIARLNSQLSRAKAQLQQARTKKERDFLNQKIRVVTRMIQAIVTRRSYSSLVTGK